MTQFLVGIVVGLSLATVVVIIWAPWKQVRSARPLDETTETRILLGEDPTRIAEDLDRRVSERRPGTPHDEWDTGELRALRSIDEPEPPDPDN